MSADERDPFHVEQADEDDGSRRAAGTSAPFHVEHEGEVGRSLRGVDPGRPFQVEPTDGAFHVEQPAPGKGDAEQPSGPDLVRAALARAKAAAAEKGVSPGHRAPRPAVRRLRRMSGSGADGRDPVLFGDAVKRLVEERGWQETTTNAGVLERWPELVGPEIADHCAPTALVDGELVLVAESTAWATQLRLLAPSLLATLAERVGAGVVTRLVVRGPAQPDWRKGPRRVQGRGPRDTYG